MASPIDNKILRNSTSSELADYFRQLDASLDKEIVLSHVLNGMKSEALPPRVANVWIHGFSDVQSLVKIIEHEDSKALRKYAIRRFGKTLRKNAFSAVWSAAGGTKALTQLLTKLSVSDVAHMCRRLGHTATRITDRELRREHMTELVKALASNQLHHSGVQNGDRRPLLGHYANIVPACTENFVREWQANEVLPNADHFRLCQAHPTLFQQEFVNQVNDGVEDLDILKYRPLFTTVPSLPATRRMSQSMEFSMGVIQTLATKQDVKVKDWDEFLYSLVNPLLRRLERHRHSEDLIAYALESITSCFRSRPSICETLTIQHENQLFGYAVRAWTRNPEQYNNMLKGFISLLPESTCSFIAITDSLRNYGGSSELCYRLLKLLLMHLRHFQLDLENDSDLEELLQRIQGTWPSSIFFQIPAKDASNLLQRLERIRPYGDFIDCGHERSVLMVDHMTDTTMHHVILENDTAVALGKVEECQQEASKSREQPDRARFAQYAIFYAIASGSLQAYANALIWLRRFNRDALTVKQLYSDEVTWTAEGLELMIVLPRNVKDSDFDLNQIQECIAEANRILLLLLETACMVLREPSFHRGDWAAVFDLFGSITAARLERVGPVQKRLGLSDEQFFNLVWKDTLEALLMAEQIGLQNGHERLRLSGMGGALTWTSRTSLMLTKNAAPCSCWFLDNLAKERNRLWEEHRRANYPAVTTLKEPWTKGLPIQVLTPHPINEHLDGEEMPFLFSLAERIVFLPPQAALDNQPNQKDARAAIAAFTDSYIVALQFYVKVQFMRIPREDRIQRVWEHAYKTLSEESMDEEEAYHFWKSVFSRADIEVPKMSLNIPRRPAPVLPDVADPSEVSEWNPDPMPERWTKESRKLRPTCLDLLLLSPTNKDRTEIRSEFEVKRSYTIDTEQEPCWEDDATTIGPQTREALIATALLNIDTRLKSTAKILARPFPSASDPRYPALFLDEEFLDRESDGMDIEQFVFDNLKQDTPSLLLLDLCKALLQKLDRAADATPTLEVETLSLLKRLARGDQPHLCLELIETVVLQRPRNSAWHRQLLSKGLLNGLPADTARSFIIQLVKKVQSRLQIQAERQDESQTNVSTTAPPIKITTVKMIAETISNAEFLDQDSSADILIELLAASSHLDIRVAIITGLISILKLTKEEHIRMKVIQALKTYAIPIAAAWNERKPLTEAEWTQVQENNEVPEVDMSAPVLDTLVNSCSSLPPSLKGSFVDEILLPVLERSADNHALWMAVFARKHGFSFADLQIPPSPAKFSLLPRMIRSLVEYLPSWVFSLWEGVMKTKLQPSRALREFNDFLQQSLREMRSSREAEYWLQHWNTGIRGGPGDVIGFLLSTPFETLLPSSSYGISHEHVMKAILDLADAAIWSDDDTFNEQESIFTHLVPPFRKNQERWRLWRRYTRPVIRQLISKIDGLRTPEWQRDPNRLPRALRDTYPLKLWLLTYPALPWLPEHRENLDHFATELQFEIAALVTGGGLYHVKYEELESAALRAWPRDYCYLAHAIGGGSLQVSDDDDAPTVMDRLRVELAETLLRRAEVPQDAADAGKARGMLRAWVGSGCEEVRMAGLRTLRVVGGEKGGKRAWFHVKG